jgi:hypothetical protein
VGSPKIFILHPIAPTDCILSSINEIVTSRADHPIASSDIHIYKNTPIKKNIQHTNANTTAALHILMYVHKYNYAYNESGSEPLFRSIIPIFSF